MWPPMRRARACVSASASLACARHPPSARPSRVRAAARAERFATRASEPFDIHVTRARRPSERAARPEGEAGGGRGRTGCLCRQPLLPAAVPERAPHARPPSAAPRRASRARLSPRGARPSLARPARDVPCGAHAPRLPSLPPTLPPSLHPSRCIPGRSGGDDDREEARTRARARPFAIAVASLRAAGAPSPRRARARQKKSKSKNKIKIKIKKLQVRAGLYCTVLLTEDVCVPEKCGVCIKKE